MITDKIARLHATLGNRPLNHFLPAIKAWDCIDESSAVEGKLGGEIRGAVSEVEEQIKRKFDDMNQKVSTVSGKQGQLIMVLQAVLDQVKILQGMLKQGPAVVVSPPVVQQLPPDLMRRIADAEHELNRIKSTMGGDAVRIASAPYHHPHDVSQWVTLQATGGDEF